MSKYICPQCKTLMNYDNDSIVYNCESCDISYYEVIEGLFNLIVYGRVFAYGAFEYCCRVYKMKAFK